MSHNGNSDPGSGSPGEDAAETAAAPPAKRCTPPGPGFLDAHSRRRQGWALCIVGGLVLLLLAIIYGTYFWHFHGPASGDPAAWGQFGDFVGGTLNSLVGLLTVLGLAWTVTLQMRQLDLSRQVLLDAQHEIRQAEIERRETADERRRTATYQALRSGIEALVLPSSSDETYQLLAAVAQISDAQSGNKDFAERWRIHLLHQLLQLVEREMPPPDHPAVTPLEDVMRIRT